MREQITLTYYIGLPQPTYTPYAAILATDRFKDVIISQACQLSGGCTVDFPAGYWMEDGAEKKLRFDGKLETETCFRIELTCEIHKAENALKVMQEAIIYAANLYEIDTDWVHVKKASSIAHHFSIKNPTCD